MRTELRGILQGQGGWRREWTTARDNNPGLILGPRMPSLPQHSLPTYHQHFLFLLLWSESLKFTWLKKFISWHHQQAANKWNVDFCNSFPDTAWHTINCDLEPFFHTGLLLHCRGLLGWTRASWDIPTLWKHVIISAFVNKHPPHQTPKHNWSSTVGNPHHFKPSCLKPYCQSAWPQCWMPHSGACTTGTIPQNLHSFSQKFSNTIQEVVLKGLDGFI